MAEASEAGNEGGEQSPITFHVKSSSEPKYTLSLPPSTTVKDVKEKLSGADFANVPPERQRLIYSGRVLKDHETLETHKVKDGHTVHLVKSAAASQARPPASSQPTASSSTGTTSSRSNTAGVPSSLATGTGNSILSGLTGARYAGFSQLPGAQMFGPDGGMGPPPGPDQMLSMLENPEFQSTMNEALQNPQIIDLMIQQNPALQNMGPGVRQMMQSPEFRRMLTDPSVLRSMSQMQQSMGMGPFGQNSSSFPAPGATNTTPQNANATPQGTGAQANPPVNPFFAPSALGTNPNPFASLFGAAGTQPGSQTTTTTSAASADSTRQGATTSDSGAQDSNASNQQNQQNLLASLFNPALFGQPQPPNTATTSSQQPQNTENPFANMQNNPFLQNPALLSQFLQGANAQGLASGDAANANPFASMFQNLAGANPAPQDNRPPEERYEEQLRQLNDMGFFEFDRNVEALRRSGGSVQGAVEYLLSSS